MKSLESEVSTRPLSAKLIVRILSSLGRYRYLVFLGNILCFICVWADLSIIGEVRKLIDRPDLSTAPILVLSGPMIVYCLLNRVFGFSQFIVTVFATNKAMTKLRKVFFQKLESPLNV